MNSLLKDLRSELRGEGELSDDIDLSKYSWFRLPSKGTLLTCTTKESLGRVQSYISDRDLSVVRLGNGSNMVLMGGDTIYLRYMPKSSLEVSGASITVSGNTLLNELTKLALSEELAGWHVFTGVPGQLGGSILMNAGTGLGELGELVSQVQLMNSRGEFIDHEIRDGDFVYRKATFLGPGDHVVGATLNYRPGDSGVAKDIREYQQFRKKSQPGGYRNCGCVFKNASTEVRAGATIDQLGMKGLSWKGFRVSDVHANFIINDSGVSAQDFLDFTKKINDRVEEELGVRFELEVRVA